MNYTRLGDTSVRVSSLCLGSLNFGWRTPAGEAVRIIHEALDAGINCIDSASCFSREGSEEIVGEALAGRRDQVVLAAKLYAHDRPGSNEHGNGRRHLIRTLEAQLRRLKTDHVDLYFVHPDTGTPMEETLRTLDDLVGAGKIRYPGLSHFRAWEVVEVIAMAKQLGLAPILAEQPFYHLLDRRAERELLPMARQYSLAILPHSPLANGMLSGGYSPGQTAPAGSRGEANRWPLEHPVLRANLAATERLKELAAEAGLSLPVFALAWLLAQPGVTAPVIGPRTEEHLAELIQASATEIPADLLKGVDAIVASGQTPSVT